MAVKNIMQAIPQTVFDTNTLTANYQLVNAGGLPHACAMLHFTNTSTVAIRISYDGAAGNGHDTIVAGGSLVLPFQANSQPNNYMALYPIGTQIWVKQVTAAAAGSFSIAGYYQN